MTRHEGRGAIPGSHRFGVLGFGSAFARRVHAAGGAAEGSAESGTKRGGRWGAVEDDDIVVAAARVVALTLGRRFGGSSAGPAVRVLVFRLALSRL